jgi:hypothetical protein
LPLLSIFLASQASFSEKHASDSKPFSLVRTKLDEAMTNASYDGHKMEKLCQEFTKVVMIILEKLISESQK